jgi:hypothetical protein
MNISSGLASRNQPIAWVERSETHPPFQHDNTAEAMGFTSFYHPTRYALHEKNIGEVR